MALETQDDYQDKIDDLMKEVEKLYDEGTDKGFKLKREGEMDQEQRALETQDDYQKAYDKLDAKMKKENEEWSKKSLEILDKVEKLENELSKWNNELKKIEKQSDAVYDKDWHELKDIWDEAKKKGFKLKGSFRSVSRNFESRKNSIIADLTDLEARKNEVLAGLEQRALETEKDYQKQYDKYANEAKKYEEEVKKWQSKIDKLPDNHTERELNKLISEKKEAFDNMTNLKESMLYILKQAKKKGFKIKQ